MGKKETFVVKVEERKCSCRRWDLIGVPCAHDVCVILLRKEKVQDYVVECYKKGVQVELYNCVLLSLLREKF